MERATVWDAMAEAYESTEDDLASRLLAALEAAQDEGGDIRGKQSAALVVVQAEPTGQRWEDRLFDLRIEDHETPVQELKRLVRMQRAYQKLNEGDEHVTQGDVQAAMESYRQAMDLVPDEATDGEAPFWVGITLASEDRVDDAIPYLRRAYAQNEHWATLVERLPEVGLLPSTDLAERLVEAMTAKKEN
jgi:tetratricopeptide (TPR) repeat protein